MKQVPLKSQALGLLLAAGAVVVGVGALAFLAALVVSLIAVFSST